MQLHYLVVTVSVSKNLISKMFSGIMGAIWGGRGSGAQIPGHPHGIVTAGSSYLVVVVFVVVVFSF